MPTIQIAKSILEQYSAFSKPIMFNAKNRSFFLLGFLNDTLGALEVNGLAAIYMVTPVAIPAVVMVSFRKNLTHTDL